MVIPIHVLVNQHLYIESAPVSSHLFKSFDTLKPEQNGRHLAQHIVKYIFLDEIYGVLIKIPLKFLSVQLNSQKVSIGSGNSLVLDHWWFVQRIDSFIYWHPVVR